MKKILSFLLSAVILLNFSTAILSAAAEDGSFYDSAADLTVGAKTEEGYEFELLEDSPNVRLIDCKSVGSSLKIPARIGGYSVKEIGCLPDAVCGSLKSISVPNTVTFIDGWTFDDTPWYQSQPDGLVYLGKCLYKYKGKCPAEVEIKSGTVSISPFAFDGCDGLERIRIPSSVRQIGCSAFADCSSLKEVALPDSLAEIGAFAFAGCSLLKEVKLPAAVIREYAFDGCSSLKSITLADAAPVIEKNAFFDTAWYDNQPDGMVYLGKVAYSYKGECPANVTVRGGTMTIADGAFADCAALESVTIPNSVESIGRGAFTGCESLKAMNIPASVTNVGRNAVDTHSPWYQSQPDGVIYLGKAAYRYKGTCPKQIELRADTETICSDAFCGCDKLENVVIPDSVTAIGSGAFINCPSLKTVSLPEGIESIGIAAFGYTGAVSTAPVDDEFANEFDDDVYDDYENDYDDGDDYAYDDDADGSPDRNDEFMIYGFTGTEAEEYASANGFAFVSLGGSAKKSDVICGDADSDGTVTILDATRIQRYIADLCDINGDDYTGAAPTDDEIRAADADSDGNVTILDATSIQRYKADLPTYEGIGKLAA